jgi:hypothetical protein
MKPTCTRCHEPKPLTEFYRDRCSPTGRRSACKTCHRADVAARRARRLAEDPEGYRRRRRAAQARYARTPAGRAAHRAAHRRYAASPKGLATAARRRRLAAARRHRKGSADV